MSSHLIQSYILYLNFSFRIEVLLKIILTKLSVHPVSSFIILSFHWKVKFIIFMPDRKVVCFFEIRPLDE
jgi:hypothetical protein